MSGLTALKDEIRRLARKESNALMAPLLASVRQSRKDVVGLKREIGELRRELREHAKSARRESAARPVTTKAVGRKPRAMSGQAIRALRTELGFSQSELAAVCAVSSAGVSHWEAERAAPRADSLAKLRSLQSIGKKAAATLLAKTLS